MTRGIPIILLIICVVVIPTKGERPSTAPSGTLFNGWGITPAGTHVKISDLPLKMVFSPDRSTLVASCAGLNPALAIIDVKQQKVTQLIALERAFNGVIFS